MPEILVDFSQVHDDLLPNGNYPVEIEEVEIRSSNASEFPYINWQLSVIEGEFQGRKLWFMTSLSPKALWKLKPIFRSLGYEEPQITLDVDEGSGMLLSPDFVGKHVMVSVESEAYQGVMRNRVTNLMAIAPTSEQKLLL